MTTVVGMFDTRAEAESAIERLQGLGVDRDRISIAMRDRKEPAEFAGPDGDHDPGGEAATAGLVSGAGVGLLVGLAVAGSTVLLPGVGTFVIGGPFVAALSGAGLGAASGGLVGGLIGAGLPGAEAEHFSAGMERGLVLVAAQVPDLDSAEARKVMDEEGSLRTYTR